MPGDAVPGHRAPWWRPALAGRVEERTLVSQALAGNPLGDPAERPLFVYLPPGYGDEPGRHYPVVYVLQGYTGQATMWFNREPWRPTWPEAVDAVLSSGQVPPVIVVLVDAWTRYGGSQYVDSPGTGRYHTYLCDEVVPFVDREYRTLAEPAHRGVQGKSSGGFGALITPMLRPDLFGALASHAGDGLYELCYGHEFGPAARALRPYDGDPHAWWAEFLREYPRTNPADMLLVGLYGVAACFSAEPDGTPVLPFDTRTGRLLPDVWERWLAWDPVRMVAGHADALRGMRGIWLDAGRQDEYFLDLAAEAFVAELREVGVATTDGGTTDVRLELFDAGHGGIGYRYPLSLAWLAERLS